jgi:hypothetical protein
VAQEHEQLAGAIHDGGRRVEALRRARGQRRFGDHLRQAQGEVALHHHSLRVGTE